jgi:hypothetical protein
MMNEVMGEVTMEEMKMEEMKVEEEEEGRHCCLALVAWQAQRGFVHFR